MKSTYAACSILALMISLTACQGSQTNAPASAPAAAESAPPMILTATVPLEGVKGRFDHFASGKGRVFVSGLGNNTVDIIDLDKGPSVHRIFGLRAPQGVGYAERVDIILIANAGDGSVRLINARDFSPAGSVELGDDADNVRIDPRNGLAVVG